MHCCLPRCSDNVLLNKLEVTTCIMLVQRTVVGGPAFVLGLEYGPVLQQCWMQCRMLSLNDISIATRRDHVKLS